MTGEITLRGHVLPIGGVKEKVLAAHRLGIQTIILPRDNEKDLAEIPEDIQKSLDFKLVENMDEVLEIALEKEPKAKSSLKSMVSCISPREIYSDGIPKMILRSEKE